MSEKITRLSAGVKANEIDLSAVTPPPQLEPIGVPAGVIGTAKNGPAFVPVTVPNSSEFVRIFGNAKGDEFGPIALREWLRNASAGTYIRVLGAGDGKQKAASGIVTNAGYIVGDQLVQGNGNIGNNIYANTSALGAPKGRTYFVGCLMSESNGSTFLSDAGLQGTASPTKASKTTSVDLVYGGGGNPSNAGGDSFTITVPAAAGGTGTAVTIKFEPNSSMPSAAANTIAVRVVGNVDTSEGIIDLLVLAINGQTPVGESLHNGKTGVAPDIVFANSGGGQLGTGVAGITATRSGKKIIFEAANDGKEGNNIALVDASQDFIQTAFGTAGTIRLTGGSFDNAARPILRGVLLAPSGVNLKLKSNYLPGGQQTAPLKSVAATEAGPQGASTGSVENGHQATLFLNGYKSDTNRSIQFSFDPDSPQYLSSVFNTDPLKIEEKGHYLYADYPVYRSQAIPTGSGCLKAGNYAANGEPISFLLTGALGRAAGSTACPDFETFSNRYQHAFSPQFISQDMGKRHNLFRVTALSDGLGPATEFKIGIQNIKPSTDPADEHGRFDLVVRRFDDTDQKPVILESFTNLSLDINSERYICRVIGDQKIRFNFDDTADSQAIVIEGEYSNKSSYIRIEPTAELKAGQIPDAAMPFGTRGHYHLQTSGSALSLPNEKDSILILSGAIGDKIVQPPIPMIQKITVGTGASAKVNSNIYWGPQFTKIQTANDPNKSFARTESIDNFTKYFGDFRTDVANMMVGGNEGDPNSALLGLVDADLFNKNMFALDKILVTTGSDTRADPKKWGSAIYKRGGIGAADDTAKTRKIMLKDFELVANRKYGKFITFLQGGFDGVNIFDEEKSKLSDVAAHREFTNETDQGGVEGPTIASFRKAIDIMATDADVDIKLLAIPGQRNQGVTDHAISAVESRFDAMYLMDIQELDANNAIITGSLQETDITNTITNFKNRGFNSSFAAAYFPDVIIDHPDKATNLTVPPSVITIGAMSQNDSLGEAWFAPAGFARTSLPTTIESTMVLKQENLDDLYDTKINPITAFAGTNLVIWGQKTLQQAANALDRVNVRRLLIEIRRLVRDAANKIIFEPNREETLVKFKSLVNPILQNVQENQGLARYKVVIDTTTTTQADVENNTIRGKIILQPNKTIEFVALDFVVTNAGTEI